MFFRLTKKVCSQIGATYASATKATNRFCDWVVDIVDCGDNDTYFLITNSFSLFSVVIPASKISSEKQFAEVAISSIREYFKKKGIYALFYDFMSYNQKLWMS